MKDHEFTKLLESMKDAPELGGGIDTAKMWNKFAGDFDFPKNNEKTSYGFRDYTEYYIWQFAHAALKPMAASLAVFVLLFTGWFSAVNASYQALPGERLYPVKLSMERVRLAIALTPEQNTELQIEFANRRLEEMVTLSASTRSDRVQAIQLAVSKFKQNVVNIKEEMGGENAELAKVVGRKTEVYKTTVQASAGLTEEEVAEVQEIIDNTKEQAVEVIITTHEVSQDEDSAKELETEFNKQLAAYDEIKLSTEQTKKIELAKALQKESAYRRAFQVLKELEMSLVQ